MTAARSALVTGAGGQVGRELVPTFERAGWQVRALDRRALDVTVAASVHDALSSLRPDLVVHLAAWTDVDGAERDPAGAMSANATAVATLVDAAASVGARVCLASTEHVFDGTKAGPYRESDAVSPRSAYGRSKAAAEAVLRAEDLCVRTSWVAGSCGRSTVEAILAQASSSPDAELTFVDDQRGCPTVASDLAAAIERLATGGATGTVHVTNARAVSWFELAVEVLEAAGLDGSRVRPVATADLRPPRPAPRPANGELGSARLSELGLDPLRDHGDAVEELVARLLAR